VPAALNNLGLNDKAFDSHIGYDIGAAAVARKLSEALDAGLVLAGYSRLVIDLNRPPGHPQSILRISDGTIIPGNQDLNVAARRRLVRDLFKPYHNAVNQAIARIWERGTPPAVFSIHSFSPRFGDRPRPWDVGVLWNRDPRLAVPLMEKLEAHGLNVGDNEPYSGKHLAYTINMHAAAAGLAGCIIEINQDQLLDNAGIDRWTAILDDVMKEILSLNNLHRIERY
jgi:predicted N-formylglutamate amidohydrolase